MWKLRALRLVVALDLSWYRHMDDVTETCFLFVQHGARFWKCLWDYFGLKRVKASEKILAGTIYKEEKWRNWDEQISCSTWECQNYKKSSQQLLSCVITTRDSLVCHMFSLLFCFEQKKTLKNVSKKLYTIKQDKEIKRRSREGKNAFGTCATSLFLHILTSTVIYLTNRFHVAVFSNRSQMTSKCGKNKDTSRRRVCQRVFHCPKPSLFL